MKIISKFKMYNGIFSFLLISYLFVLPVHAIIVEHEMTFETKIAPESTIRTNGLVIPKIEKHGWVSSNTEAGAYTLESRDQLVLKLDRRFGIKTWSKNIVKENISVTVRAEDTEIEKLFLSELMSAVKMAADKTIEIQAWLGIQKITIRNSWIWGTDCTVLFTNGKKYKLEYLEISANITVPENSDLKINGEFMEFNIDDLNGSVEATLNGSVITSPFIRHFTGEIYSSTVKVKKVETGLISACRSKVTIDEAEQIQIGNMALDFEFQKNGLSFEIPGDPYAGFVGLNKMKEKRSTLNKYNLDKVGELEIKFSLNDKFNIEEVENCTITESTFSDYKITSIGKMLAADMEYGAIDIYALSQDSFQDLRVNSFFGSITIFTRDILHLNVEVKKEAVLQETYLPGIANNPNTSIKLKDDFVLQKVIDDRRTTYFKGDTNLLETAPAINLYCNNCELDLH